MRAQPASRQLMRAINEATVLGKIRRQGPISRVQIAREVNLSAATVTSITADLIARNLVVEESVGKSTGGRRPILLRFNRTAGVALGVKLTEREMVMVTTDLAGGEERRWRVPIASGASPDEVVAPLAAEARRLKSELPGRKLAGIGVGIAGIVERPSGFCRYSPFLRWRNVALQAAIADATGAHVTVENDVNMLTFAVGSEIAPPGSRSFLVLTLGRGVGLGMMIDGQPYRGSRGQGGEFGHTIVDPDGPVCECGNRGCLEAIVGIPAVLRQAGEVLGEPVDEARLVGLVAVGDDRLAGLLERIADVLGVALANLVNVLNPEMLVISGEGAWLARALLPRLMATLRASAFGGLADDMLVTVEAHGDEFWARGAAGLMLEETFQPRTAMSAREVA